MPDRFINETTFLIHADLKRALAVNARRPFVLGIAGAQGSGKTTIARVLKGRLGGAGLRAAHLSLDDFYYSRAARRSLAARVSPLFVTRGPPGTHDVASALSILAAVKAGAGTLAPVFDKGQDEPLPRERWPVLPPSLDIVIFEGWCLGAKAQEDAALIQPLNTLERTFDAGGGWRRAVNDALEEDYQDLFTGIDRLVFLRAPSFDAVRRWRTEQEHALADSGDRYLPGLMSDEEIAFFIQHFERLTLWAMEDLPHRAAMTLHLDERRRVMSATRKS